MPKVLVVEDELDLQQVLKFNLKQAGFEVQVASLGAEALSQIAEEPPALVLLDITLPDVLGTEVCRNLKSNPRTASIPGRLMMPLPSARMWSSGQSSFRI